MNHSMQPIMQHLFQASSLEDISRERLESFVEEYPCFGFGHYLLSRKLRAESAGQYLEETHRTSLYFSNPFWLQWLLENTSDTGYKKVGAEAIEPATIAEPVVEHPFAEQAAPASELVSEPLHEASAQSPAAEWAPVPEEEIQPVDEEQAGPTGEEPATPHPAEETHQTSEQELSAAELLLNSIEEARVLRESLQKLNEDFQNGPTGAAGPGGHQEARPAAEPAHTEEPIHDEEPPFILEEEAQPVSNNGVTADPPAQTITKAEPELVFEPFHTIDYFASQGIKLKLDENPSDSLGKQLKSFTDWLKVMRKLPQKDREIVPDRVTEQTIQSIAAHSIEGKEVVTETMAEVLAKQGMPERARVLYEKLSLLNPEKRAYFAAKIEQLNTH
jgi:hypothetical protein